MLGDCRLESFTVEMGEVSVGAQSLSLQLALNGDVDSDHPRDHQPVEGLEDLHLITTFPCNG